jgi:hypothetical protein
MHGFDDNAPGGIAGLGSTSLNEAANTMEDPMAMLDWNEYRKQIIARIGEIASSHRILSRVT